MTTKFTSQKQTFLLHPFHFSKAIFSLQMQWFSYSTIAISVCRVYIYVVCNYISRWIRYSTPHSTNKTTWLQTHLCVFCMLCALGGCYVNTTYLCISVLSQVTDNEYMFWKTKLLLPQLTDVLLLLIPTIPAFSVLSQYTIFSIALYFTYSIVAHRALAQHNTQLQCIPSSSASSSTRYTMLVVLLRLSLTLMNSGSLVNCSRWLSNSLSS